MRWPRPLPQVVRLEVVRLRSDRVRVQPQRARAQVVRLRAQHRVDGDVVQLRVVDLAAHAGRGDLVELAHALPAPAQVLHFRLGDLAQLRLADELAWLVAAGGSPSRIE